MYKYHKAINAGTDCPHLFTKAVNEQLEAGNFISVIKCIRLSFDLGLKDAKEAAEEIRDGNKTAREVFKELKEGVLPARCSKQQFELAMHHCLKEYKHGLVRIIIERRLGLPTSHAQELSYRIISQELKAEDIFHNDFDKPRATRYK